MAQRKKRSNAHRKTRSARQLFHKLASLFQTKPRKGNNFFVTVSFGVGLGKLTIIAKTA